jgi:type I restriction enzyme M protein
MNDPDLSSFIWSVADLLRGDYKQPEYGKMILPFTVLLRLDCVLEKTKAAVLTELAAKEKVGLNPEPFLLRKSAQLFFNTSPLDMKKLMGDQDHINEYMYANIRLFSHAVRYIFESFEFHTQIDRLAKAKLLYLVTEKFANIDLRPEVVSDDRLILPADGLTNFKQWMLVRPVVSKCPARRIGQQSADQLPGFPIVTWHHTMMGVMP